MHTLSVETWVLWIISIRRGIRPVRLACRRFKRVMETRPAEILRKVCLGLEVQLLRRDQVGFYKHLKEGM